MTHDDPLLRRPELLARGVGDAEIRRARRNRSIVTVQPGLYVPPSVYDGLDTTARHLLAVRAAADKTTSAAVVSHQSAAVVHGFDMWKPNLERVHFSTNNRSGGRRTARRHLHPSVLTDADVTIVDGIAVTTAARTVADLARAESFEFAVCVGDSALRLGATDRDSIYDSLRGRGSVRASRAIAFIDARSETVGESRSRVYLQRNGFPAPSLQLTLFDEFGLFLARTDFAYEEEGVIGEFDGLVKYMAADNGTRTPSDVVIDEKAREDRLREHGWVVVRWNWNDLEADRLAGRLRAGFATARSLPRPRTTSAE
ncbi:CTP synthase [Rhodococcoides trifolii]|uniref:CTP synthase n=1 Tax=Rhodococcoides trifolii TaxID=908250 RepID=A0A917LJ88_9NOCA|nr:hypothetical protein [Rhodococcus trifolii]GGG29411.1 CTP synthase [Rhodococcus trifolii]